MITSNIFKIPMNIYGGSILKKKKKKHLVDTGGKRKHPCWTSK
jgi:hypothetical protein